MQQISDLKLRNNGYQSMMKTAKMLQTFEKSCNFALDFWICFFLIIKKLKNLNTFQIETLFKDPGNGQNSKEKASENTKLSNSPNNNKPFFRF